MTHASSFLSTARLDEGDYVRVKLEELVGSEGGDIEILHVLSF